MEDEELQAFRKIYKEQTDLFMFAYCGKWDDGNNIGDSDICTYATTRKEGWWKQEPRKMTVADCPVGSVVRLANETALHMVLMSGGGDESEVLGWAWPQEVWEARKAGKEVEWRKS